MSPHHPWLPTACAPADWPVKLLQGRVALVDGSLAWLPEQRILAQGWGARGPIELAGPLNQAVPHLLDLRWFAYREDRFYTARCPLPAQGLAALFGAGARDGRRSAPWPFERLVVGMAPGGAVVVWVATCSEVVEVGRAQGSAIELPWSQVACSPVLGREAHVRQVLTHHRVPGAATWQHGEAPASALYAQRHQRHPWRPWVSGAGRPGSIRLWLLNGEVAHLDGGGPAVARHGWAVPAALELGFRLADGRQRRARIDFDEAEALAAWAKLSAARGDWVLHLETTPFAVTASLRRGPYLLPLERARSKVHRLPDAIGTAA